MIIARENDPRDLGSKKESMEYLKRLLKSELNSGWVKQAKMASYMRKYCEQWLLIRQFQTSLKAQ